MSQQTILDPYPAARMKVNECCESMITARELLQQKDLTPSQKQELAASLAARARDLLAVAEDV